MALKPNTNSSLKPASSGRHAQKAKSTTSRAKARASIVDRLCQKCGLCCNGALFDDVESLAADDRKQLRKLGFAFWRKGRKSYFDQPCQAFDGALCRVYDSRPCHCRQFKCRLLQRTQQGDLQLAMALRTVRKAKRALEEVRKLSKRPGDSDDNLPLMQTYARAMSLPMDLSRGPSHVQTQSRLMATMDALMRFLNRQFRGS